MEIYYQINGYSHSITVKEDSFKGLEDYQLNALLIKAFNWALKAIEKDPIWIQKCKREQEKQIKSLNRSLERLKEREYLLKSKDKRTPEEAYFLYTLQSRKKEIKEMLNSLEYRNNNLL